MSSSVVASLVFLVVPLTALFQRCGAADSNNTYDPKWWNCFPFGNSGKSVGPYETNLGQFLEALPSNAISNNGFFNGTMGLMDTVFGVAMCHADIQWPDQCKSCLEMATAEAPKVCPWRNNASVAYRGCILLYSDVPILASEDDDISNAFAFPTPYHAASVPDGYTAGFYQTRLELFSILADEAANSPMMIAWNNLTFNSTHNLYGLAQCSRGLPREICSQVIGAVIGGIQDLAGALQWSEGLSLTANSYYIRYDLTPFRVYEPLTGSGVPSDSEKKPMGVYKTRTGSRAPSESETKGGLVQQVQIIVIPISITIIILLVMFIVLRHYQEKQKIVNILKFTDLKDIPYGEIKSATGNFDGTNLLGEGGFGKVYKGTFNIDGKEKELAVKCVTNPSAIKQLLDELKMLAKLEHKNVVQLVGFCRNDGWFRFGNGCNGLYICNEFIRKGSLDTHIFASSGPISWQIRYNIIRDICNGLQYLHQLCNNTISHMDLKPNNILLDEEMSPKIADFGLSRAFVNTKTHTYTTSVVGTNGYMAPEFLERGRAGCKCDIYSLGVLILGIVMRDGPKAMRDPCGVRFIDKIRKKFIVYEATTPKMCRARDPEQLKKDASLEDDDRLEDVEKCIGLAFECVDEEPDNRPLATAIYNSLIQVTASGRAPASTDGIYAGSRLLTSVRPARTYHL